ncbi:MAG TPA: DUF2182 domain-containing protein [Chloroflexota bacterium]|nr:DUF2182 domain-containing protein [Chloroflexota bacterium]
MSIVVKRSFPVSRTDLAMAGALLLVAGIAWMVVIGQAHTMGAMTADRARAMADMGMGKPGLVTVPGLLGYVGAWGVMMAAMMLPSALPMMLLYRRVSGGTNQGASIPTTGLFVLGYLIVWTALGVPLYLGKQALAREFNHDPRLGALAPYGVGVILVMAALYQFTRLKAACLRTCRSPLAFLMEHWRAGARGALPLSVEHALYCVGCCWGLMAVLVVAGAMGIVWASTIALLVFAEKLLPRGRLTGGAAGVLLLALGAAVLLHPTFSTVLSST